MNADRQNVGPFAQKLDFADSSHWVVGSSGLGFAYSAAEREGYLEGGGGGVWDFIPWSKLAPYLRKDGIVPKADWVAAPRS
jgi:hypothetical protein